MEFARYSSSLKLHTQTYAIQWNIEDFNIHCAIAKAHYGESEQKDLQFEVSLDQDPYISNDGPIVRNKWRFFLKKPCEGDAFVVGVRREVNELGERLSAETPFGIKVSFKIDRCEEGRETRIFTLEDADVFQLKHGSSKEWEIPQLNTTTDVEEVEFLSVNIVLEIVPDLWVLQEADPKDEVTINESILSVCEDIGTLFPFKSEDSELESLLDFTFKAFDSKGDEQIIKAHKCIIAARSPVFRTMLENPQFKESKESSVTISDVSYEALVHFLKFLYSGEIKLREDIWEDNSKIIIELVYAADKYQVPSLMSMCDTHLPEFFTHENAYSMFDLCLQHNLQASTPKIEKFMEENILSILQEKRKRILKGKE